MTGFLLSLSANCFLSNHSAENLILLHIGPWDMNIFIQFIVGFGIVQSLLLSIALLIAQRKNQSAVLMGILLLVEAISLNEQLLHFSGEIYNYLFFLGWSYPLSIWRPILLYFFVIAYFTGSITFRWRQLFHLIFPVVYVMFFYPLIFATEAEKVIILERDTGSRWTESLGYILFFVQDTLIRMGYYWFAYKLLKKHYSNNGLYKTNHPRWIANFALIFIGFFYFRLFLYFLNSFDWLSNDAFNVIIVCASSFIIQIIAWFMMTGMKWPAYQALRPVDSSEIASLKQVLEDQQAYLNDELTVGELSGMCNMKPERLTELIRLEYRGTFKEVINGMRVEEAKKLIAEDLEQPRLNLLAIAMDSGFNNKVTFYRAFKKSTGLAPSDYLKQLKSTS